LKRYLGEDADTTVQGDKPAVIDLLYAATL